MIPFARAGAALLVIATVARGEVVIDPPPAVDAPVDRLGNGLRVVLAEDAAASSVVVHVRYDVGSAHERASEAGYAHLVERLFAAGSVHVKAGEFEQRITAAGGWTSSRTTVDHISLFAEVPPGALELALWLEAERMAGLADGITDEGLARERDAIAAEWRSAYEDQPFALVARRVQQALWGKESNSRLVLGDGVAVTRATRAAVRAFVRTHIVPANATVVIVGRFDRARTQRLVERYFGWLPKRTSVSKRPPTRGPLEKATEATVADPIAKVVVAYRTHKAFTDDAIHIEVIAKMLGPRLQRALADSNLATDINADVTRQQFGGELRIQATPIGGASPGQVALAIRREIAALRDRAVAADEVSRAARVLETELVVAVEGLAVRADLLASSVAQTGKSEFLDAWVSTLRATRAEHVQATAKLWLTDQAAVTVIGK